MKDLSKSYLSPHNWLPYYQQRVFIKRNCISKGIGINILFNDEEFKNKIPIISCGLLQAKSRTKVEMGRGFYCAGWGKAVPCFDNDQTETFYRTTEFAEESAMVSVINYFIPLDIITSQKAVEEFIVEPLKLMYEGNFAEAEKKISGQALTVEKIKGL